MEKHATSIEISPVFLRNEFSRRRISLKDASLAVGHGETYFSTAITHTRRISGSVMLLLNKLYGIREEDVILKPVPQDLEPVPMLDGIDYDRLYKIVYNAVKNGMTDALNGDDKHA